MRKSGRLRGNLEFAAGQQAEGIGAILTRLDGEWWMGHHVLWPNPMKRRGQPVTAA